MPKVEVKRSIEIDAAPEKVFEIVSDLGKWRPWNPWLITEPEAVVEVDTKGKHYEWHGRRTGAGEMRITGEQSPHAVDLELTFLKPFKSRAKVGFRIEKNGDGARVSWTMQSSLPFFMFFMTNMMKNMIGMDYDRGLSMLKDYVETGTVPSKVEDRGESEYPGCKYVGIERECSMDEMGATMAEDFERLQRWLESSGNRPAADAFSIYRKWDLSKGRAEYTCGIPLQSLPDDLPSTFVTGEIPKLRTHVLEHIGPYRHLGNAWSTGMQMGRGKEIRVSKAHKPFETYQLDPDGTLPGKASNVDTRTAIHFAVK